MIKNRSHWVRDIMFDEDRSQVRRGNIPQVMVALRNTTIGVLRWAGYRKIAKAGRSVSTACAKSLIACLGSPSQDSMASDAP